MSVANGIIANARAASRLCALRNARVSSSSRHRRQRRTSCGVANDNRVRHHSNSDKMNSSSGTGGMISLVELLSTCVDAAQRGCAEIRAVQERRTSSGGQLASTRKDVDDPRSALTEADTAAQIAIVNALRATWPGLRIVGEEEEEEGEEGEEGDRDGGLILRRDLCALEVDQLVDDSTRSGIAEWKEPLEVLTVFVDPVDGTREFVEGRLDAVQCLVGVSCRGRAVAGAIGLPFAEGAGAKHASSVVWGVAPPGASSGIKGTSDGGPREGRGRLAPETTDGCVCVTGDSKNESLAAARAAVGAAADVTVGGAGNKMLAVAEGRADVAVMHFGTSLWDTCAPEAVLRAAGGKVTDLFGAPLVHSPDRAGESPLINKLGVLATSSSLASVDAAGRDHAGMAKAMCADATLRAALLSSPDRMGDASGAPGGDEPQAVDVVRGLDGAPLDASWVGRRVASSLCGGEDGVGAFTLRGYSAPESGAVRGLMSDACRLELAWEGGDAAAAAAGLPATCFYKRVAMGDLEYARVKASTQPLKIDRDVRSAAVEAAFLACTPVTTALTAAGVKIPRCFDADLRPCHGDLIESSFALLLEDFSPRQGWRQARLLTPSQARASLTALARLHATFMPAAVAARRGASDERSDVEDELLTAVTAAVWPSGTYWQPDFQPASQMTELARIWQDVHLPRFSAAFADALPEVDVATVGERLQDVAVALGSEAHPFSEGVRTSPRDDSDWSTQWKTVIHGDPKAGNIFFRPSFAADEANDWEVGLIDFQWMGFGVGASDAAHVLCAACDPEALGYGPDGTTLVDVHAASKLLDHYHGALCDALAANGAAASVEDAAARWTRAAFQTQYESCLLDMCRVVFGYQWVRVKASPETLAKNASSMGRNSYNKSLPNAMWLVRECDALLKARKARQC